MSGKMMKTLELMIESNKKQIESNKKFQKQMNGFMESLEHISERAMMLNNPDIQYCPKCKTPPDIKEKRQIGCMNESCGLYGTYYWLNEWNSFKVEV